MTTRLPFLNSLLLALAIAFVPLAEAQEVIDVALITSLQGNVGRVTPQGRQPLQAFVKLKRGDVLALGDARLQIVYFENGRQETWQGSGRLEIAAGESTASGLPSPAVKTLPAVMVRQIARTPALESQGRAGVVRLRSLATPDAIEKLEESYRRMRMETVRSDLSPELYLLSGLFEMRELDRVEQVLRDLQLTRPGDVEVGLMAALYQKALRNARENHAH